MIKKTISYLILAAMLITCVIPAYADTDQTDETGKIEAAMSEINDDEQNEEFSDAEKNEAEENLDTVEEINEDAEEEIEFLEVDKTKTVYNSYPDLEKTIEAAGAGVTGVWSFEAIGNGGGAFTKIGGTVYTGNKNGSGNLNFASNDRPVNGVGGFAQRNGAQIINYIADIGDSGMGGGSSMSKYWMRPSIKNTLNKEASLAKVFTAPRTGEITITAKDVNGDAKIWGRGAGEKRKDGAQIYIVKTADAAPTYAEFSKSNMYTYKFDFTSENAHTYKSGSNSVIDYAKAVDFKPISLSVNEGEKLYFIVNAANTNSDQAQAKYVHWNPVVSYNLSSTAVGETSESMYKADPDDVFTVNLDTEVVDSSMSFTADNVVIAPSDNGEAVKSASLQDGSFKISFTNLKSETAYTVSIKDIKIVGADESLYTSFEFTTKFSLDLNSYNSQSPWPDVVINTTVLKDTMKQDTPWAYMYSNDAGKTYNELTEEKGNWTRTYVQPKAGKETDYSYVGKYTGATEKPSSSAYTRVISSSADKRIDYDEDIAVIGKWWMRAGKTKDVEAAKQFTAPESGTVNIGAIDEDGEAYIYKKGVDSNAAAAQIKIVLRPAGAEDDSKDRIIWKDDSGFDTSITGEYGDKLYLGKVKFDGIPNVKIEKGDKLLFAAYMTANGSSKDKYVYWNPTVTYTDIRPSVIEQSPVDSEVDLPLNEVHRLTFDYPIVRPSDASFEIYKGEELDTSVSVSASLEGDGDILSLIFGGLEAYTEYKVVINDLKVDDRKAEGASSYTYSFKTGAAFQINEQVEVDGGSLKKGTNKFFVEANNASSDERFITLLIVLCKGTKDDYEIKDAVYTKKKIVGFTDIEVELNMTETEGYFVKTVLLDDSTDNPLALNEIKYFGLTQ